MWNRILLELKTHAPFTAIGAIGGILFMILFRGLPREISHSIFNILHPGHVLLSAFVTASMYKIHKRRCDKKECNHWMLLVVGYVGAVGIATVSDCLIPFLGEWMLDMPHRHTHIGFIEQWWIVNPLAILGIAIACYFPSTRFPHAGHVLLSTWASLFHILMAAGSALSWAAYLTVFVFLFLSVWLPCCVSDIVFPLLFVRNKKMEADNRCCH